MAKKLQENVTTIDDAITDKGTVSISMKAFKWIIGAVIGLSLLILGVAWGFKASLESKIQSTKTEIFQKIDGVNNRIDEMDKEDIKPSTQTNYRQDGDIKVLYDRTSKQNVNYMDLDDNRPDALNTNRPNFNPNGN